MSKKKKKKNLYETLEINPLCNKEDIRKAYKKKVKQVHPDRGGRRALRDSRRGMLPGLRHPYGRHGTSS